MPESILSKSTFHAHGGKLLRVLQIVYTAVDATSALIVYR